MHMIERICEYLLSRSINDDKDDKIMERLKTLPNFSTFNINKDGADKANSDDLVYRKIYLSGRQCTTLLKNYTTVLRGCPGEIISIWGIWKNIVEIITMDYDSLRKKDNSLREKEENVIQSLRSLVSEFLTKVKVRFSMCGKTSYYIHILCTHVPDLLESLMQQHQSLLLYSNQGMESSHAYDAFIEERHVARATKKNSSESDSSYDSILGDRKKLTVIEWREWLSYFKLLQIFMYKLRTLIMSVEIKKATWNRMFRRIKTDHRKEYSNANKNTLFNFAYDFSLEDSIDNMDELSDDEEQEINNNINKSTSLNILYYSNNDLSYSFEAWKPSIKNYEKETNAELISTDCKSQSSFPSQKKTLDFIINQFSAENESPYESNRDIKRKLSPQEKSQSSPKKKQKTEEYSELLFSGNDNEILVEKFNIQIISGTLKRLLPNNWLNDDIINFFVGMCREGQESPAYRYSLSFYFSTYFYSLLSQRGCKHIRNWTKSIDLFTYEKIIVPVNTGHHWTLVVVDIKIKTSSYFDSLLNAPDSEANGKKAMEIVKNYLLTENSGTNKELDIRNWVESIQRNIPQQQNMDDCGVFLCKFISNVVENRVLNFNEEDIDTYRKSLARYILQGHILD